MRPLPPLLAAVLAAAPAAQAATVRVVPLRAASVPEAPALAVARAAEAAIRESSTLVIQPAPAVGVSSRRCGAEDPACWSGLASRAGTDYGLVVSVEPVGGLTVDLVLVDLKAHRVGVRRFTTPGVEAASAAARAAVEALVPPFLRRGYGGFTIDLPRGARLKVDGRVVLSEPSSAPVAVPNGRHEVDLLLPDGSAVLSRAEAVEGQAAALHLDLRPPPEERRPNETLQITSAALWTTGTLSIVASLALGLVGNVYWRDLTPCQGVDRGCYTLEDALRRQQTVEGLMRTANILLVSGGVLAAGGVGVFTFDLVQGGKR